MDISSLTSAIENAASQSPEELIEVEEDRKKLIEACQKLTAQLKKPHETFLELTTASYKPPITRLAIQMRLFEIAARAPNKTISLQDLAVEAKVEESLLLRVLRILVSISLFTQIDQTYTLTNLASQLLPGSPFHSWIILEESNQISMASLNSYFTKHGFSQPADIKCTPFNHAFNTQATYFEYLASEAQLNTAFNHVMRFAKLLRGPDWYEFYPVESLYSSSTGTHASSGKEAVIIDLGGGTGVDLINLRKHHTAYAGRLVLQDLPTVLADADTAALSEHGIETYAHSFLTAQPEAMQGATAYVIKNCLHDWPDREARDILSHVAAAMGDESRLLVAETCLAEQGVPFQNAVFDWVMMIQFAGLDRMDRQWRALFDSAGLKVKQVWNSPVAAYTVVFELVKKS